MPLLAEHTVLGRVEAAARAWRCIASVVLLEYALIMLHREPVERRVGLAHRQTIVIALLQNQINVVLAALLILFKLLATLGGWDTFLLELGQFPTHS